MLFKKVVWLGDSKSVFELKEQDHLGWYRLVYAFVLVNKIVVVHSFKKQSAKTSKRDLEIVKARLSKMVRGLL